MPKGLEIKNESGRIIVSEVSRFNLVTFITDDNDLNKGEIINYLDHYEANQLITHLSEQLTKIGVQVDILKEK